MAAPAAKGRWRWWSGPSSSPPARGGKRPRLLALLHLLCYSWDASELLSGRERGWRVEKVAGDGCFGGEGQVEVVVGVDCVKGGIECRICQEEGEEDAMDSPCACTGTLKFMHRKCIQRWCNKKGNITCEICNQVYSPNYVVPPTKCCSDEISMDLRQSWVGRIDPHDSHFLTIVIAEQQLLHAEFDDCMASNSSGATCCQTIAPQILASWHRVRALQSYLASLLN